MQVTKALIRLRIRAVWSEPSFVCVEVLRPRQPNVVMSSAVSLPNHTFTGQALPSKRLTSIVHIPSPETDNCPSWISGRERMTVENISWSISTKECCRPRRGLNPRPPGLQSDGASNWATEAGMRSSSRCCFGPVYFKTAKLCMFVQLCIITQPLRGIMYILTCAPSEDANQSVHPRSPISLCYPVWKIFLNSSAKRMRRLIWVFAGRMCLKLHVYYLNYKLENEKLVS